MSYLHTLAQDAGRDVTEDLTEAQLSELYPLAHLVVGNPEQRQPVSGLAGVVWRLA